MRKPKLLFIRFTRPNLPAFVERHFEEQALCLRQFFDVTIAESPDDYDMVCDQHQPEIVLMESGVYAKDRPIIRNMRTHAAIPRVGFLHCDAYCKTRDYGLADMEMWEVDAIFTTAASLPSYTPEIADSIFVWPNFVDGTVFRDYGQQKTIPILFTGSQATHYPWRRRIYHILSQNYPTMQTPHKGWFSKTETSRMLHGEPYARLINSAIFAPACGTIANEFTRKLVEIPACGACLVSPPMPLLKAAGFVDMANCVMAEDSDVVEKLDFLFRRPELLGEITNAGRELVEAKHQLSNRGQLFEWFTLWKQRRSSERIVQTSPFLPLTLVAPAAVKIGTYIESEGLDRELMVEGDRCLLKGDYTKAEHLYRKCINYHEMVEAQIRLGICRLHVGDTQFASECFSYLVNDAISRQPGSAPDPVPWAYYGIALLCNGQLEKARQMLDDGILFPNIEFVRVIAVLRAIDPRVQSNEPKQTRIRQRRTIHSLPTLSNEEWVGEICRMLVACKQDEIAARISRSVDAIAAMVNAMCAEIASNGRHLSDVLLSFAERGNHHFDAIKRRLSVRVSDWVEQKCKKLSKSMGIVVRLLQQRGNTKRMEEARTQETLNAEMLRSIIDRPFVSSTILFGAVEEGWATNGFLKTVMRNPEIETATCICSGKKDSMALSRVSKADARIKVMHAAEAMLSWTVVGEKRDELAASAQSERIMKALEKYLDADVIVVLGINSVPWCDLYRSILRRGGYLLEAFDPAGDDGYAAFVKKR